MYSIQLTLRNGRSTAASTRFSTVDDHVTLVDFAATCVSPLRTARMQISADFPTNQPICVRIEDADFIETYVPVGSSTATSFPADSVHVERIRFAPAHLCRLTAVHWEDVVVVEKVSFHHYK